MSDQVSLPPLLRAEDLWLRFWIRYHRAEVTLRESFASLLHRGPSTRRQTEELWALRGVGLEAEPGDVIGLVGRNAAGKSSLLKALAGIYAPDRGRVVSQGKVGCLMSFGVGFRQNLSGRENVYLSGSLLGLARATIAERMDEIIAMSELEEFIDAPVRAYSAGMKGRLGFSIAVHIQPDILLLDEVLTVGDASFRARSGSILDRFARERKIVVLASHDMELLRAHCSRVLWLERGRVEMSGRPDEVIAKYVEETTESRRFAAR